MKTRGRARPGEAPPDRGNGGETLNLVVAYRLIATMVFRTEAHPEGPGRVMERLGGAGTLDDFARTITDDLIREIAGPYGPMQDIECLYRDARTLLDGIRQLTGDSDGSDSEGTER